jgi:hypothetical protein
MHDAEVLGSSVIAVAVLPHRGVLAQSEALVRQHWVLHDAAWIQVLGKPDSWRESGTKRGQDAAGALPVPATRARPLAQNSS